MLKVEVIGNLGADAVLENKNGRNYVSFRVAHSEKYTDVSGNQHENTTWVQCFIQGDAGKLLQYLKKGAKVFARGNCQLRVYSSPQLKQMVAGLSISCSEVELCGNAQMKVLHDKDGIMYSVDKTGLISEITEQITQQQGQATQQPQAPVNETYDPPF